MIPHFVAENTSFRISHDSFVTVQLKLTAWEAFEWNQNFGDPFFWNALYFSPYVLLSSCSLSFCQLLCWLPTSWCLLSTCTLWAAGLHVQCIYTDEWQKKWTLSIWRCIGLVQFLTALGASLLSSGRRGSTQRPVHITMCTRCAESSHFDCFF